MRFQTQFLSRCALAALVLFASCGSLFASSVNYDINFSAPPGFSVGVLPSATFTYDPNAGFSNFIVDWANNDFDITSFANAPSPLATTGCNSSSTPQYGFLIITQSTGCEQYSWGGMYYALEFDIFFTLTVGNTQDEILAEFYYPAAPSPSFNETIDGSWTVTAESASAPEPGTIWLILFGTATVAAAVAFRRRQV